MIKPTETMNSKSDGPNEKWSSLTCIESRQLFSHTVVFPLLLNRSLFRKNEGRIRRIWKFLNYIAWRTHSPVIGVSVFFRPYTSLRYVVPRTGFKKCYVLPVRILPEYGIILSITAYSTAPWCNVHVVFWATPLDVGLSLHWDCAETLLACSIYYCR